MKMKVDLNLHELTLTEKFIQNELKASLAKVNKQYRTRLEKFLSKIEVYRFQAHTEESIERNKVNKK